MTTQKPVKKKGLILVFFLFILIPVIWFFFLSKDSDQEIASKALTGKWLRADGTYTIEIKDVQIEGMMVAAYFNPNPIHVDKSEWRFENGFLQIYVELQDENYPGSIYQLTYDNKTNVLHGTYYQAVDKATYEVGFNRK